jgi:hypothetical protein
VERLLSLADRVFMRGARWSIIGLYAVAFVVLNIIILSAVQRFEAVSAGLPILEVPSFAPPAELGETARAYPPEAAHMYRTIIQPLDILFPLFAGLFFGSTIYLLVTKVAGPGSRWRALSLFGAGMIVTDYLENVAVFVLLRTADAPPPGLEAFLRIAIWIKFPVGIVAVLSVLTLFGVWLVQRVSRSTRFDQNRLER